MSAIIPLPYINNVLRRFNFPKFSQQLSCCACISIIWAKEDTSKSHCHIFTFVQTLSCIYRPWVRASYKYSNIYIEQDATLHSLFYLETALHVLGGTSTHHQQRIQLYLQHLVFVTPLLLPAAIAAGSSNSLMMDRGTVWKHVAFHSKNKFVKLVHLVDFIIRNPTRTESSNILLICKLKLYHILKQDLQQAKSKH